MKKVLLLGSGMVAGPVIRYLLDHQYFVTIATPLVDRAYHLAGDKSNFNVVDWTIEKEELLSKLVKEHDLVISLIPYIYHVKVARQCILYRKNMLTTSYVSPEMKSLHDEAKNAGIIILNECGLDPGIDHMSAMKIIDHVHQKKGTVDVFYSYCGALPAPESADNPFRYRFSWSPRGVLLAGKNSAQYVRNGYMVNISPENLFKDVRTIDFPEFGQMEVYPNRDSLSYIDLYGIHEVCSLMRGTIRYPGWCEIMDAFKKLNLFSDVEIDSSELTYRQFIARQADLTTDENLENNLCTFLGLKNNSLPLEALKWVGFLDNEPINKEKTTPFDITADLMIPKMLLEDHERDMVQMMHYFEVSYPDGSKEVINSSMLVYGEPGKDSAVAKTVALPAAVASCLILENKISLKGVHIPIYPEIYLPVLDKLAEMGICLQEESKTLP
ncbi:MAG: saccharopine dehydrogenase [Sphingobacteriales bacterium]|nr:saccharopine dehydrogenase [Sphingobacteriales bacterium]